MNEILSVVGISIIMVAGIVAMRGPESKGKREAVVQAPQYPNVDQINMVLTLRPGERFVSIQSLQGGYFTLVVEPGLTVAPRTFQVYTGQMGDGGVMLSQPAAYYTIKEQ